MIEKEKDEAKNSQLCLLVIAGGQGARLWPISHKDCPKQFTLVNPNETFIQATVKRYYEVGVKPENVYVVVTNEKQHALAVEQLCGLGVIEPNIVKLPSRYGYAGCMSKGADFIGKYCKNAVIINTPADQYIDMTGESRTGFIEVMNMAIANASSGVPTIVGLEGIERDAYRGLGHACFDRNSEGKCRPVTHFIEKPKDDELIDDMIRGKYSAANTGINVWRLQDIKKASKNLNFKREVPTETLMGQFKDKLQVAIGKFSWKDCGTLKSLLDITPKTGKHHNNAILGKGNFIAKRDNCRNTLLYTVEGLELYGCNLRDVSVVVNPIGEITYLVVVAHKYAQEVKELVDKFKDNEKWLQESYTLYGQNNFVMPSNISHEFRYGFVGVSNMCVSTTKLAEVVDDAGRIISAGRTIVQVSYNEKAV